jgi:predicted PurR-regulated permease PerM
MLIAVPVTAVLKVFISMYFSCDRSSVFFTGK